MLLGRQFSLSAFRVVGCVAAVPTLRPTRYITQRRRDGRLTGAKQESSSEPVMPKVKVFCASCRTQLLRYNKGGTGALVKLHPFRVTADSTITELRSGGNGSEADSAAAGLSCPECRSVYARVVIISGQVYRKRIGGKIFVEGGVAAR